MPVLFDNALLKIRIGPLWDASTPTFSGTAASIMGIAQRFEVGDTMEKANLRGAGQFANANYYHSGQGMINISNFIPAAGHSFATAGGLSKKKYWVEITHNPNSVLSTPTIYTGVIEEWKSSGNRGDGAVEEIKVDLNAGVDPVS